MNIINRYAAEEMVAASPSRAIVMLYDEAIGALRTAVLAMSEGDIEGRCNAVNAAIEIVGYLYMTLDETQGEVAENLGAIYGHIISRLPQVNLHQKAAVAEEAIALLEPLRDSWHAVDLSLGADLLEVAADLSASAAAWQMHTVSAA